MKRVAVFLAALFCMLPVHTLAADWEDYLISLGYEYNEEMCIWEGWDGFYTEDQDYYLWDEVGYCDVCEWPSEAIGHAAGCVYSDDPPTYTYEEAGFCPECETFDGHREGCPRADDDWTDDPKPEETEKQPVSAGSERLPFVVVVICCACLLAYVFAKRLKKK